MRLRVLLAWGVITIPFFVEAMPSAAELDAVAPVVQELMQPEQEALKSGKKTRTEVADAAIALVAQADGEAAKLLLAKGAFSMYVKDGQFDKAEETLNLIRTEIPDVPPQYLANLIETSLKRVSRKNGGQLYRILDETKALARCANETKKLEAQAKAKPDDAALMTNLAEHYAVLGDWEKALGAFEKGGDAKAAGMAKAEKAGAEDAKAIADFWWDYPNKKGDELEKPFKQHAAELYGNALASGKLVGLNKVQVERRIKEAESLGEAVVQAPAATISGGKLKSCVVELPNGEKLDFIICPAGTFKMGWPADVVKKAGGYDEAFTEHKVKITRPFLISKFAITRGQWGAVTGDGNVGTTPKTIGDEVSVCQFFKKLASIIGTRIPNGYEVRFPTEAEHEYALRAGDPKSLYSQYHLTRDDETMVIAGTNKWGLANMRTGAGVLLCMQDTVGTKKTDFVEFEGGTILRLKYENEMVDPIWDVGENAHITWQGGWCNRGSYGKGHGYGGKVLFHVVIAPKQELLNIYPRIKGRTPPKPSKK